MKEEFLIQTGELKILHTGIFSKLEILYSGMPNENTFAITALINKESRGFTPEIYYPKESVFITIIEHRFKVIEVTPEYIILHPEKIK